MKLLIFIPSPRDLRQFHDAISKIKHDKLWMKYMPYNLPTLQRKGRVYHWLKKSQTPKNKIIEVPWSGTAFMIMARHVVEKMNFWGDGPANGDEGFSFDVGIAHDLMAAKIPQYVDTGVFFEHYRSPYARILNLYEPQTWYDTADGRTFSGVPFEPELIDVDDIHHVVFTKPEIPEDGKEHVLSCRVCGGIAKGIKFEETAERLDHAIGLYRRRPCGADRRDLLWDGQLIFDRSGRVILKH